MDYVPERVLRGCEAIYGAFDTAVETPAVVPRSGISTSNSSNCWRLIENKRRGRRGPRLDFEMTISIRR